MLDLYWRRCLFPLAAVLFSTGCASVPVTAEERSAMDRQIQNLADSRVALSVDACVIRDQVGEDFILRDATMQASSVLQSRFLAAAESAGLILSTTQQRFACGALAVGHDEMLPVADHVDAPALAQPLPLSGDGQPLSSELVQAHKQLWLALNNFDRKQWRPEVLVAQPLGLSKTQSELLMQTYEADYLWLLNGGGAHVSKGKSIGVALLSSLFSAGLTGGAAISASTVFSGVAYSNYLLDLRGQGWLVWYQQQAPVAENPANASSYPVEWAHSMLRPLYPFTIEKGVAKSSPGTKDTSLPDDARVDGKHFSALQAAYRYGTKISAKQHVPLRQKPKYGEPIVRHLSLSFPFSIEAIKVVGRENWWFVRGERMSGWVLEADLKL